MTGRHDDGTCAVDDTVAKSEHLQCKQGQASPSGQTVKQCKRIAWNSVKDMVRIRRNRKQCNVQDDKERRWQCKRYLYCAQVFRGLV